MVSMSYGFLARLQDIKLTKENYLQFLFSVYLADAGTVSVVRKDISHYNALHAQLMSENMTIDQMFLCIKETLSQMSKKPNCIENITPDFAL